MPATNQQTKRNNPRPVAANVPRPVQIQNMPNIVQPEPVAQEIRARDPSPAPHIPRAEEPIDNHQDQFFSPVEDEIHSPYRRSQRLASLPRINYDETALARAAVSRSAGNDQTPTTSKKGSMRKTMKEIRKSLTTALNATLTTPLTPSRSPSPIPRQPLPVRSRPQTDRNNSPKPQQYSQSSNRSTDQSPSRTPDQNNRYRNTSRYQQRSPSPGRNNDKMQDRSRNNRYSPQNSRSYPRQQSQSPNRSYSDRDRTSSQYRQSRRDYTPPRNQSPGQHGSNYRINSYNRSYSQYRQNEYRPSSPYRQPDTRLQSPYRSTNNPRNYSNDRHRNPSPRPNYNNQQRYRSPAPSQYSGHKPGINCSPEYAPWSSMFCKKCCTFGNHHEHTCPTYYYYCPDQCAKCKKGHHYASECKTERRSSSPFPSNKPLEYRPSNSKN
jgi:hypothetical protein